MLELELGVAPTVPADMSADSRAISFSEVTPSAESLDILF